MREHAKFAWPGGYARFAILGDGETLCVDCVNDETNPIFDASGDKAAPSGFDPEWTIVGWSHTGEVDELEECVHCGKPIE